MHRSAWSKLELIRNLGSKQQGSILKKPSHVSSVLGEKCEVGFANVGVCATSLRVCLRRIVYYILQIICNIISSCMLHPAAGDHFGDNQILIRWLGPHFPFGFTFGSLRRRVRLSGIDSFLRTMSMPAWMGMTMSTKRRKDFARDQQFLIQMAFYCNIQ